MSVYLDEAAKAIRAVLPAGALPEGADTEALLRTYAVLMFAKGREVTNQDVHDAWVAWMLDNGKRHESMVPYAELPADVRAEDSPFARAIRTVAAELTS